MAESLQTSVNTWQMYWGDSYTGWLFTACFLILLFFLRNNKKLLPVVIFTGAAAAVFFLPVTEKFISKLSEESIYWRLLWVVPCFLVIALAFSMLIRLFPRLWMRGAAMAFAVVLIALSGRGKNVREYFEVPANKEQVPPVVAAVADCILEENLEDYCVATDDMIASYLRVYTPMLRMPYGRRADGRKNKEALQLYQYIAFPETYITSIPELSRIAGATHVVMRCSLPEADEVMGAGGFRKLASIEDYTVYTATP